MIFRYYVGKTPMITIADVDLTKEILVKDFDSFSDRGMAVSMVTIYVDSILSPAVGWVAATLVGMFPKGSWNTASQ